MKTARNATKSIQSETEILDALKDGFRAKPKTRNSQ